MPRSRWFGQPELRFQSVLSAPFQYYSGLSSGFFSSSTATTAFYVDQMQVAALAGYTFDARQQWYALLGPAVAWRVNKSGPALPTATASLDDAVRDAVDRAPAAAQLQLHGGLGWWGRHLGVEARYTHGLTPLVRQLSFHNRTYDFLVRSSTVMFTVGYHGRLSQR
ncbi:hypothetical protein Q5H92_11595 [Hymenobacter sp. M29]|uniref:Outer membrane protein beta-barrel domain-containing protein n=1 Tax=Hymenobacter mellowenesis TaxID=3063995 RepID=A0ABT9AAZ5_9BACT|nr:hypothetical protein [Hymenobacter sp. M29]MDO7847004.1 hypothetical protein [Hymenobacter sp. M29]